MTPKKWFYLASIIIVTGLVLFFYISFNSTFISKWKAKQVGLEYLNAVYEPDEYSYESVGYNFKDRTFFVRFSARTEDLKSYEGTVEVGDGLWPDYVLSTYLSEPSKNEKEDEQINKLATEQLKSLLAKFELSNVEYSFESPTLLGYTAETFSITEKLPLKPEIYISNKHPLSKDASKKLLEHIRTELNAANVYYVDFLYLEIPEGSNSYSLKNRVMKDRIINY